MKVAVGESNFKAMLRMLQQAEEIEVLCIPWRMPLHNEVTQWHRMQRAQNAHFIHEAVRLSAEHLFDREDVPDKWEWGSLDKDGNLSCPVVDPNITRRWFNQRWAKVVLAKRHRKDRKTKKKLPPVLDESEATIVEMLSEPDGRTHIHVHTMTTKPHDEDGVHVKYLIDGLRKAGLLTDDDTRYVSGVTQSQGPAVRGRSTPKSGAPKERHEPTPHELRMAARSAARAAATL